MVSLWSRYGLGIARYGLAMGPLWSYCETIAALQLAMISLYSAMDLLHAATVALMSDKAHPGIPLLCRLGDFFAAMSHAAITYARG